MPPKFGTSGLRGLVGDLTSELIEGYTAAFLCACSVGTELFVGVDLRPSSPRIAENVIQAAREAGKNVTYCGAIPTPALALVSMEANAAAIMVTGSHIPADRNGLKFYLPAGEITKLDEIAISAAYEANLAPRSILQGTLTHNGEAAARYIDRYVQSFGMGALRGLRLGIYQHSSVARDILVTLVEALGATAIPLALSDEFVPVDTEAIDITTRQMLVEWATKHRLDAILSTDGDADRPMLTDAAGQVIPGDLLGIITARNLSAKVICAPISSNSMLQDLPEFAQIRSTKIGSPFVIASIQDALTTDPAAAVVGFEPNGGFLLGYKTQNGLTPLLTRDAVLPMIASLAQARGIGLARLVAELPSRFTATDRLEKIPPDVSTAFLASLAASSEAREIFFAPTGQIIDIDQTDGLRLRFARDATENEAIVHLRASGNAPEFRVYVEANTREHAQTLLRLYLTRIRESIHA
jgi:phosphomannomutase